jgi:hypothetical protein
MYRTDYPVDNPPEYWKISRLNLCLVFLDHLVEEISKEWAFILASYLNPASLLTLTPEIVDRLFYVYQTDLPRKVDSVDEVEC